jgi:predicted nucleotidyltransferase
MSVLLWDGFMGIDEILRDKRADILRLAAQHGAYNVRIFGSVARGDAGPDSDVDVLVDLELGRSLFDLGGLLMDLQDLLGRKVHLVTEKAVHWYIRDRVLKEAVPI